MGGTEVVSSENKAKIQHMLEEGFDKGNWAPARELFAPDVVVHRPYPGQKPGWEGLREEFAKVRAAYPDKKTTLDLLIAEDDLVAFRWTIRGTHQASYRGRAPSGKQLTWTGVHIARFADGRIVEYWDHADGNVPGSPRHLAHASES
jgi:steroid delta-isomerase-like uncharacterized protein